MIRVKFEVNISEENTQRRCHTTPPLCFYLPRLRATMAAHWARVQSLLGPNAGSHSFVHAARSAALMGLLERSSYRRSVRWMS